MAGHAATGHVLVAAAVCAQHIRFNNGTRLQSVAQFSWGHTHTMGWLGNTHTIRSIVWCSAKCGHAGRFCGILKVTDLIANMVFYIVHIWKTWIFYIPFLWVKINSILSQEERK